MRRVGVIAAMAGELKPLVEGWKPLRVRQGAVAWQGTIDGFLCIAVCAGMGKLAAERACAIAAEGGPLDALVSVGWAGALSCGMQPGSAYVLNEVVDGETGGVFPTNSPPREREAPPLKLVTIDHVAHVAEKRSLGTQYQAVLVDMEAATVARVARSQGIPFYCLKAVYRQSWAVATGGPVGSRSGTATVLAWTGAGWEEWPEWRGGDCGCVRSADGWCLGCCKISGSLPSWFRFRVERLGVESRGIPHFAKSERSVGGERFKS